MNPQYMPQSQFGASPQGFPLGKQGSGMPPIGPQDSFNNTNSQQQPPGGFMQSQPYGYKSPMGPPPNAQTNTLLSNNPMQGSSLMQSPHQNPMGQSQTPRQAGGPPLPGPAPNNFTTQGQSPLMSPKQIQNGILSNQGPPPPSPQNIGQSSPQRQIGSQGQGHLPQMAQPQINDQGPGSIGPPPINSGPMGPPNLAICPPHPSFVNQQPGQMTGLPPQGSIGGQSIPGGMPPPLPSGNMPPPLSSGNMGNIPPPLPSGNMGNMPPLSSGNMGNIPPPLLSGNMGNMPPPLSSGNIGNMPPPPTLGGIGGIPTSSGNTDTNPPPTSGNVSLPPTSGVGSMPPPTSGTMPHPASGSVLPPPISGTTGPPQGPMSMPSTLGQMSTMPAPPLSSTPGAIGGMPPNSSSGPLGMPPTSGALPPSMVPPSSGNSLMGPSMGGPPMGPPSMGSYQNSNAPLRTGQMPPKTPLMPPPGGLPTNNPVGSPRTNPGMPPMPPGPGQFQNKIGGPGSYPQPPMGSNQAYGANQLANQMNDMNLGGNRQYPGGPIKPSLNGENMNLPHMPPPLNNQNQGQYVNGQPMKGPQPPLGYPPMPGQQGQMPGGPYPSQQYQQQPQQVRRLDPDQMPSPIQVTHDDQKTRSGIFCTNQKGLVPPLVSTNFITQDQGNAGPRFIRSTMYNVPTTTDTMKQTAVPFGLVISPLARTIDQEYPPPIVDFGELGPVRCVRCKAYMSPFMQFIDAGRRFQCLFCKATTEVPAEYFQHLDHTGQRVDRFERPELILGAYEFVATKDYCRNNTFPKAPAIIFVIDVSYNNIKSGLVQLLCSEMKEILKHLPVDQGQEKSKMKVGFITYNNTVHFYNIKGTLAQPQMMVVGDTQEMFMPLLDGFLCDIEDSAAVIDSLMTQIPAMFAGTRETEIVLLPALQAGLEALKASECAGKLLVFHSTLPTAEAPGRLKNRDERKLLGTEKERTVLTPQTQAYNQLGQDCVAAGCCVDLFITNNTYIDIATIGQVARLTGGEIFKYTYFQADVDGARLVSDVITDINRPIAFDSIMRVRTSTGVRPTDFYGHFYMSNTTDMEIAAIDCDKAVAIEVKHDDKLTEEEGVYIQVALLYTSCAGQRRLRILNLSLKTCSQMADLYRSCELDTVVNFFAKQSVYKILENNPKVIKDAMVNRCAQMLACYRKNCASPSSAGQLILPECMKLLPLYVNCMLKSDALSGGSDMTLDDRSFVMQCVITMDIPTSVAYFYPRLIPLHEIQNGSETPEIPNSIRCTIEKMVDNGVYLLENGIHMLMWIGLNANQEWIQSVFGAPSAAQVDIDKVGLPELDNSLNITVRNLIDQIRAQRHRCMRLTVVRQRDKLETVFRHFLMEDRGQDGSTSYVDFLCHMHKEIRQLLS